MNHKEYCSTLICALQSMSNKSLTCDSFYDQDQCPCAIGALADYLGIRIKDMTNEHEIMIHLSKKMDCSYEYLYDTMRENDKFIKEGLTNQEEDQLRWTHMLEWAKKEL